MCVCVCHNYLLCSSYHQHHIHLQPVDSQLTGSTCLHTVTGGGRGGGEGGGGGGGDKGTEILNDCK